MRTKFMLKAKKFFFETFCGKIPTKEELYEKTISSSFMPRNFKVVFSMYYTKEVVEDHFSNQLKPFGLSISQMEIIEILYYSNDSSLNQDMIGKYAFSSKANVSSQVTKLEQKELVKRIENSNNKRQKLVSLTKKGEELLYSVYKVIDPYKMPDLISKEEAEEYIRISNKIQRKIKSMEEPKLAFKGENFK